MGKISLAVPKSSSSSAKIKTHTVLSLDSSETKQKVTSRQASDALVVPLPVLSSSKEVPSPSVVC